MVDENVVHLRAEDNRANEGGPRYRRCGSSSEEKKRGDCQKAGFWGEGKRNVTPRWGSYSVTSVCSQKELREHIAQPHRVPTGRCHSKESGGGRGNGGSGFNKRRKIPPVSCQTSTLGRQGRQERRQMATSLRRLGGARRILSAESRKPDQDQSGQAR